MLRYITHPEIMAEKRDDQRGRGQDKEEGNRKDTALRACDEPRALPLRAQYGHAAGKHGKSQSKDESDES